MSNENAEKPIIDKAIFLAVVPAYIYFISFLYEMGFCERFKIPKYLIQPSLTTILIFASSFWLLIFSSIKLMGFAAPLIRGAQDENQKHLKGIYIINFASVIISIIIFFSFPFSWKLVAGLFLFIIFINFMSWAGNWLLRIREKKTFKEKIEDINSETDYFDIYSLIFQNASSTQRYIIFTTILLPYLCYFIGVGQSFKQTQFETISNKDDVVVLKKYDDMLVCSTIDLKTHLLGDSLILYKIGPDKSIILKVRQLGPIVTGN